MNARKKTTQNARKSARRNAQKSLKRKFKLSKKNSAANMIKVNKYKTIYLIYIFFLFLINIIVKKLIIKFAMLTVL